jgi:hypothetical protein
LLQRAPLFDRVVRHALLRDRVETAADEMSMHIDEAGQNRFSCSVDYLRTGSGHFGAFAYLLDSTTTDEDRGAFKRLRPSAVNQSDIANY